MFDLRAQRQVQPVFHQGDLILHKPAEPLPRDAGREKSQNGAVAHIVLDQPVAESPDEVMPLAEGKSMLKIDIVGVEVFGKHVRDAPVGAIVIHLQFEIRVFGKRV